MDVSSNSLALETAATSPAISSAYLAVPSDTSAKFFKVSDTSLIIFPSGPNSVISILFPSYLIFFTTLPEASDFIISTPFLPSLFTWVVPGLGIGKSSAALSSACRKGPTSVALPATPASETPSPTTSSKASRVASSKALRNPGSFRI